MSIGNLKTYGLKKIYIVIYISTSVAAALSEGFGMAMFLPLLEYIETGKDAVVLAEKSNMWRILIDTFESVNLKVNLTTLLGCVLTLLVFRTGLRYARQMYSVWLTQRILHKTRTKLITDYFDANYGLFDRVSTGESINLATMESERLSAGFHSLFECFAHLIVILGFALVLLCLSVSMTILAVVYLSVAALVVSYYIRHTKKISREWTKSNEALSFSLVERLTAIRTIKLTATVGRELKKMREISKQVCNSVYGIKKMNARINLLLDPMVVFLGVLILYISITYFNATLAKVGVFMLVLLRLMPLCREFLCSHQGFMSSFGSFEIINNGLLVARNEQENIGGDKIFTALKTGIELKKVTFSYNDSNRPALTELNLFLPAAKVTALVGPSGAGKSTLVDLIPLLRRPQKGVILFDGVDAESYNLASLRKGIAFVSQDAFIFNDTVLSNITFARQEVSEKDVWEMLERARASEFVKSLPAGLETVLGERGITLSGGQRQRLSLARALLQESPIMILDEPTSALDSESERDIQIAIDKLQESRKVTIIIIAHRLSTIKNADNIVVLKNGKIVEQGSHDTLLLSKEWYYQVSGMQTVAQ